jgi:multidrug efflux pump subunit AcrB
LKSSATRRECSSPPHGNDPNSATSSLRSNPNYPQVKVELDREKARTLGVPVNEVFQTMSTAMGGAFVNDFNRFGRLYRVYVQAEIH